jgi:hypothetical protein
VEGNEEVRVTLGKFGRGNAVRVVLGGIGAIVGLVVSLG